MSHADHHVSPGQYRTIDGHHTKWTLGVVCIAVFMLLLDVTVVNNALPSILKDPGSSLSDLQWVVDAYALTLAAFVLTFGSLADLIGRRLVFVLGLGVQTSATSLSTPGSARRAGPACAPRPGPGSGRS